MMSEYDVERIYFCPKTLLRDVQEFSFCFLEGLFHHAFPLRLGIFLRSEINSSDLSNICSIGIKKKSF